MKALRKKQQKQTESPKVFKFDSFTEAREFFGYYGHPKKAWLKENPELDLKDLYLETFLEDLENGKVSKAMILVKDRRAFLSKYGLNTEISIVGDKVYISYYGHNTEPHWESEVGGLICDGKVLINADDSGLFMDRIISYKGANAVPVSFTALEMMFDDSLKKFSEGSLKLLDATPDTKIPLTEEEKELSRKRKLLPKLGFTKIKGYWHQSGSALFYEPKTRTHAIMGSDEGSYFITKLLSPAKTVKEAFKNLTPKEAKAQGTFRQGEWFFIPTEMTKSIKRFSSLFTNPFKSKGAVDMAFIVESCYGSSRTSFFFDLPKESPDSNEHTIMCRDLFFDSKGNLYVKDFSCEHSEHDTIEAKGLYLVKKNISGRSFSQRGVD